MVAKYSAQLVTVQCPVRMLYAASRPQLAQRVNVLNTVPLCINLPLICARYERYRHKVTCDGLADCELVENFHADEDSTSVRRPVGACAVVRIALVHVAVNLLAVEVEDGRGP